ncbi:MAG TPA: extracellular solute-binding protein [Solirubrobacteraceae bacterium]
MRVALARRRRLLAVGLSIAAAGGIAAGCGSSSSKESSKPGSGGGGSLTVWHYFAVDTQTAVLKQQDASFIAKHPGVKIKLVFVPFANMNQKLIAAAAAGTGPDVIIADGAGSVQLAAAHAIKDMTSCVDTWSAKDDLLPVSKRVVDGKTLGVLPYGNLVALWYNKTILDKYHLKPPTTLDEMETDLATVTKGGDKGLLLDGTPTFTSAWSAQGLFTAQGVEYPNIDTPATTSAFQRLGGWASKGWVPRDVTSMDQPTAMNKFLTGKYAFTINGNWEIEHAKKDAKFDYGVTTLPNGADPGRPYISGETAMLGNFSKNGALACQYLNETWFSPAGQRLTLKGIGSLPMLKSLQDEPQLKSDPIISVFVKQASNATSVPPGNQFTGNSTVWGPAISKMWAGNDNPAGLAKKAMADLKGVLAKKE